MLPPTCRLLELDAPWRHPELIPQLDPIVWPTAGRTFPPGAEREAFRERWLGRYLKGSDVVLLALADGVGVAGYLVGALTNPSAEARFADIDYFAKDFAPLMGRFPAHLH